MASTAKSEQIQLNGELSCPCAFKNSNMENKVTVVLGAQWGDEGKGKVVDLLAVDADIVCRCQVTERKIPQYLLYTYFFVFFLTVRT